MKTTDICERTFAFSVRVVSLCQALFVKRDVSQVLATQILGSGTR